ncbi:MAG: hypothetical protein ACFFDD_03560 [Promethearchaeota archaeon]
MNTLADSHVVYVEAIRRLMGDDGLKANSEANRFHGLVLGNEGIDQSGLRKGDLQSINQIFGGRLITCFKCELGVFIIFESLVH